MAGGATRTRRSAWLIAAGLALAGGLGVWALFFHSNSNRSGRVVPMAALPEGFRPVDLKVALLFDCYEHALENVPPRWDTSSRQRNWKAPPPPVELLREACGMGILPMNHGQDARATLRAWIEDWDARLKRGILTTQTELSELEGLLRETALPFDTLFKVGLAASFVDNDAHAACWFRAAIHSAEAQETTVVPVLLLGDLAQMGALWRIRDYVALDRRFSLEQKLCVTTSEPDSLRAAFLHAEMLYYQDRIADAAQTMARVKNQFQSASIRIRLDPVDTQELNWVLGMFLFHAGRAQDAEPHLRAAANFQGFHTERAMRLHVSVLAMLNRVEEAEAAYAAWLQKFGRDRDPSVRQHLRSEIAGARARSARDSNKVPLP